MDVDPTASKLADHQPAYWLDDGDDIQQAQ